MNFELFLALKYLKAKRKYSFITFISFVSVIGIAIGVCAVIVVMAVMNGFDRELRSKLIDTNAHIWITAPEGKIDEEEIKEVLARYPFVEDYALMIYGNAVLKKGDRIMPVEVKGSDFKEGFFEEIKKTFSPDNVMFEKNTHIICGEQIALQLNLRRGDPLLIISPEFSVTPFGAAPKTIQTEYIGSFKTGLYKLDSGLVYVPFDLARYLFGKEGYNMVEVKLTNARHMNARTKMDFLRDFNFKYNVNTLEDLNYTLFNAMKLEKTVSFIVLALIIAVAAFNIVSTMIMTVMEKIKDIGILKSIGATRLSIFKVFLYEGIITGILGVILGCLAAGAICWFLYVYGLPLPSDIYYIEKLPLDFRWHYIFITVAIAFILTVAASVYPAYFASKFHPSECLKNE